MKQTATDTDTLWGGLLKTANPMISWNFYLTIRPVLMVFLIIVDTAHPTHAL